MNLKVICIMPYADVYCDLIKNKIYTVDSQQCGLFRVNGWWYSQLCFLLLEDWRNEQINIILDENL